MDNAADRDTDAGEGSGGDNAGGSEADRGRRASPGDGIQFDIDAGGRERDVDAPDPAAAESPPEFVDAVDRNLAEAAVAAGEYVGGLLTVIRDHPGCREEAGDLLCRIGLLRPAELEVWTEELVATAGHDDPEVALPALRALAELAGGNPRAARPGLEVARERLNAPEAPLRAAALSVVGSVGADDPESVRSADRQLHAALTDAPPSVRVAAAGAAGKLLAAAPGSFPRTASALLEALEDDHDVVAEYVRVALVHFARERPSEVPEKRAAIEELARVDDADLSVEEGATKTALVNLLGVTYDLDV